MKSDSIKISVPKPCNVNLDEMQTVGNGKFCTHCSKTVWDFTNWSEEELAHFFSDKNEAVCGRFLDFQLNKAIPKPKQSNYSGKIAAAALGFSLFFSSEAMAQKRTALAPIKKLPIQKVIPSKKLIGIVKDDNGIVMQSVPVTITDSAEQELMKIFTDKDGCFEVNFPSKINSIYFIKVTSPRFETFNKKLENNDFLATLFVNLNERHVQEIVPRKTETFEIFGMRNFTENTNSEIAPVNERPPLKITPNPIYDEIDINRAGGIEPLLKNHPFLNRGK